MPVFAAVGNVPVFTAVGNMPVFAAVGSVPALTVYSKPNAATSTISSDVTLTCSADAAPRSDSPFCVVDILGASVEIVTAS